MSIVILVIFKYKYNVDVLGFLDENLRMLYVTWCRCAQALLFMHCDMFFSPLVYVSYFKPPPDVQPLPHQKRQYNAAPLVFVFSSWIIHIPMNHSTQPQMLSSNPPLQLFIFPNSLIMVVPVTLKEAGLSKPEGKLDTHKRLLLFPQQGTLLKSN